MDKYTTYVCKDGRVRVYLKEKNRVMSYPKFLVEQTIGRELLQNEQVHHKDGNPLNNDIDNLEIRLLGEHQKEHNQPKYYDKTVNCEWCGNPFMWTAKQQKTFYGNQNRKNRLIKHDNPFCSKKCTGEFGRHIQSLSAE